LKKLTIDLCCFCAATVALAAMPPERSLDASANFGSRHHQKTPFSTKEEIRRGEIKK